MTAVAMQTRPRAEAQEPAHFDPVNDILSLVVANCQQVIDLGHGAQLEARLARLFPKPEHKAGKPGNPRRTSKLIADGETALAIVYCTEVLRKHAHRLGAESEVPRAMAQTGIGLLLERLRAPAAPEGDAE